MPHQAVHTDAAPAAIGPYSQAIQCGAFLFCSGQVALDPSTGELIVGDVEAQTQRAMQNIGAILEKAGCTFGDVVKTTIFLVDMADFAKVNAIYGGFFDQTKPARSTVAVAALPRGARVEIEVIAEVTRR